MANNQPDASIFNRYKDNSFMLQPTHEDTVKMTAEKILSQSIPWDGYRRAELIQDSELELIKKYDKKPADARKALIQKDGEVYSELFLQLLVKINKENFAVPFDRNRSNAYGNSTISTTFFETLTKE